MTKTLNQIIFFSPPKSEYDTSHETHPIQILIKMATFRDLSYIFFQDTWHVF